jgi:hypothetical protein
MIKINNRILKPYVWNLYNGRKSNDLDYYYNRMFESGLKIEELGKASDFPIFLVQNDHTIGQPNILIIAGIHGEESGGCWGLLNVLMKLKLIRLSVNLSFIPIMNPFGFSKGIRYNEDLKTVNSGYFRTESGEQELTEEGKIFNRNFVRFVELSKNGFLSCQEDVESKEFYLYEIINGEKPDFVSQELLKIGTYYFSQKKDGFIYEDGWKIKDGIVMNAKDGTIDDYLFSIGNVHRTITTKTPGLTDINKRVHVNEQLITKFVKTYNVGRFFI